MPLQLEVLNLIRLSHLLQQNALELCFGQNEPSYKRTEEEDEEIIDEPPEFNIAGRKNDNDTDEPVDPIEPIPP